jgi:hypothetical protein
MPNNIYAIFRQVDGGPEWLDTLHWQVDLHDLDLGEPPYPVAVAWLSAYSTALDDDLARKMGTTMDYILVPDHLRRRGYARRLVMECERRWPDLVLTEAISPGGEAFLDAMERQSVPQPGRDTLDA